MNTDIRLSINFWTHPKTVKLERRLGLEGVRSLQILWLWAARNRADGRLSKLDAEAIEIVADWRGASGKFVETALELVWLEEDDEGYRIHDWQEHNGWAADADKRSDKARLGKLIQRRPDLAETLKNQGITGVSPEEYRRLLGMESRAQAESEQAGGQLEASYKQATSRAQAESEQAGGQLEALAPAPAPAPSPSPSPSLIEDTHTSPVGDGARPDTETESGGAPPKPRGKSRPDACPHKAVIDLYHELLPECPHVEVWPEDCRRKLAARWREDKARQDLGWWRHVFQRVGQSDFLMGRVEGRGFVFSLTWFVEPKNFAKVLNGNYDNRSAQPAAPKGGTNIGGYTFPL